MHSHDHDHDDSEQPAGLAQILRMMGLREPDPVVPLTAEEQENAKRNGQGYLENMATGTSAEASNRDIQGLVTRFTQAKLAADGRYTERGGEHGFGNGGVTDDDIQFGHVATVEHLFGQMIVLLRYACDFAKDQNKPFTLNLTAKAGITPDARKALADAGITVA